MIVTVSREDVVAIVKGNGKTRQRCNCFIATTQQRYSESGDQHFEGSV